VFPPQRGSGEPHKDSTFYGDKLLPCTPWIRCEGYWNPSDTSKHTHKQTLFGYLQDATANLPEIGLYYKLTEEGAANNKQKWKADTILHHEAFTERYSCMLCSYS
jgi:hypothetical protein